MNEMRKLMESVEQLNEADTAIMTDKERKAMWAPYRKEQREKKAAMRAKLKEVLSYFSNKRTGGKIKPGYECLVKFDDETRSVESLSLMKGGYRGGDWNASGQSWRGRDHWSIMSQTLVKAEIYKVTKERVL